MKHQNTNNKNIINNHNNAFKKLEVEAEMKLEEINRNKSDNASDYLKYLDKKMVGISDATGETIDIVDTMGFQELKDTMDSMREHEAEKKAQQ